MDVKVKVFFLALGFTMVSSAVFADDAKWLETELAKTPSLSGLENICPSDLVPKSDVGFYDLTEICAQEVQGCFDMCVSGESDACFALGNRLQHDEQTLQIATTLFKASCKFGLASGCTNAAAVVKSEQGLDAAQCYTKTFQRTCALDDPWGCTMYAVSLIYGEGVEHDLDKALAAMEGSCRFGETDRACSTALEIEAEIKAGEFDAEINK